MMRITFELDAQERAGLIGELAAALAGVDARAIAPTLEDVQAYASAQEWEPSLFDPTEFYRFNSLRGWVVKDWKLAAAGWYSKEKHKHPELACPDYSEWEG